MVNQDDEYPNFPVLECQACEERFQVPRKWIATKTLGNQIFIDWEAADELMSMHHRMHSDELINGVEGYLRANT